MRRWILAAALGVAAAAPATAEATVFSPPILYPPELACCMGPEIPSVSTLMRDVGNRVDEWSATALASAPEDEVPEHRVMRESFVVSYGTGETHCTISAYKDPGGWNWDEFEGITDCNHRVQQTAQTSVVGPSGTVSGPLCSGSQWRCRSAGTAYGTFDDVRYQISIVAPYGEGWIAAPSECSGAGTDNLKCTF